MRTGCRLALFSVACLIHLPNWVNPHGGGDMVGLAYIIICLVTTGAIVLITLVVAAARWWSGRHTLPNA